MEVITYIQTIASTPLDVVVLALTNLGSEQAYIVMLVVTYLGLSPRVGQRLGAALLASFYFNQTAKAFFDTPRPFVLEPSLLRSEAAGATALGPAFPSGHAQGAATFWLLAAYYVRKAWFWVLALTLVTAIALSRIYLGVHFPVDIVGGVLLALGVILAALLAFRLSRGLVGSPRWQLLITGVGAPLLIHWRYPTADSALILGALAAFITGPVLLPYRLPRKAWQRGLVAGLGVLLVFAGLVGSSLALPEAVKRSVLGGFLRYLLLGYIGTLFTPWLARRFGFAPHDAAQI